MGRRIPTVPSGLEEVIAQVIALLDLMRNPQEYAAKVKELQDLVDEANVVVEQEVGAQEVSVARLQAATDRNMAAEELKAARLEAEKIRGDARAEIESIKHSLKVGWDSLKDEMADQRELVAAEKVMIATKEEELNVLQKSVQVESVEAKAVHQLAMNIKHEFEAKLEKLHAGIAGL